MILIISIISNVGVLAVFKYYNFFIENIDEIAHFFGTQNPIPYLSIILPVGLSFHTFQAMSYTIEVYRGNQKAEKHLGIYSLYVMFFPQLVAGPIERPQNILHQFHKKQYFDYDRIISGLRLVVWGLFKKVVIADRLAIIVNPIYDDPLAYDGWTLLTASYLFAFQIYCDFSGYSDIAIGTARVMGFNLMENFKNPYFATNISEFWSRWHISLSTWFRDYIYIPLGGNRVGKTKWLFNLMVIFLISGFWHGANWTFIIWGALHGSLLVFAVITQPLIDKIYQKIKLVKSNVLRQIIGVIITFHTVTFAWIFFRADSFQDALVIIKKIGHVFNELLQKLYLIQPLGFVNDLVSFILLQAQLIGMLTLFLITFLLLFEKYISIGYFKLSRPASYFYFTTMLLSIIILGQSIQEQFIYFQF